MTIVYQNGVAGKICANPECGWKPVSEFRPSRLLGVPIGDGYKSRCKKCWNAQKRVERISNPKKHKDTARKYVEANREHIRELKRKHQEQNPEKYDEALRKYREAHREEINRRANPNKLTLYTNNRRARKLKAEGSHTQEEWQELKAFYDFKCLRCGKREPEIKLTRDHVIPLTQGGTDGIDNIQPLCARCNSKKNHKHIDYR